MALRPNTKTLQNLLTEVKRLFGDESGVQLSNEDITRWANEAQMEIVNANGAIKAKSSAPSVVNQKTYSFPDIKIQSIASLHYGNLLLPNMPMAEAERIIYSRDPQLTAAGTPELWYEWAGEFTLWPTPNAVQTIDIYYTAYPTELTGDPAQTLSVADKFWPTVVNYVMAKCYEMDEEPQMSQMAEGRFREALQAQLGDERQAQDMAYPVVQEVGYY